MVAELGIVSPGPDNLSGCSIFIDRTAAGAIIVYHANRQGAEYSPTVEQRRNFSFEREVAVAVKHVQHDTAQLATYAGATHLGSLFKKRYMSNAAQHEAILRFGGQGDTTVYGTTVAGFRRGGNWLFWYQTWKCDMGGNNYAVIKAEQFYPRPQAAPGLRLNRQPSARDQRPVSG